MASKDYLKGEGKYIPYYPFLKKVPPRVGFQVNSKLLTKKNYDSVMELAKTSQATSFDVETTGLRFADSETRLITINLGFPGNINYVAFYYKAYFPKEKQELLPTSQEIDDLVHAVLNAPRVYAHNRFFDQRVLMHKRGFIEDDFFRVHDTWSLMWLMDTNVKDGLGLKQLAVDYLGLPEYHFNDAWEGEGILMASVVDLVKYCGLDSYCTLELGELFYRIYREHYPTMWRIELEFNNAIFNWEEQVRVIDGPYLEKLQEKCDAIVEETKEEYYSKYGIINLGSNEEKSDALFALGYDTCLEVGSRVITEDGYTRLNENSKLVSYEGKPLDIKMYEEVKVPGYEIQLSNGIKVRCSREHKFQLLNNPIVQEVEARQLKVNDCLGTYKDLPFPSKYYVDKGSVCIEETKRSGKHDYSVVSRKIPYEEEIDEDLAYLMGIYLGDGSVERYKCKSSIRNKVSGLSFLVNHFNYDWLKNYLSKWESEEFTESIHPVKDPRVSRYYDKLYRVRTHNKEFANIFVNWCGYSETKHTPEVIYHSPKSVVKSYLAGLIDTDGTVNKDDGTVTFLNTNLDLINGCAELATWLGIPVRVQEVKTSDNSWNKKALYRVVFFKNPDLPLKLSYKKETQDLRLRTDISSWYFNKYDINFKNVFGNRTITEEQALLLGLCHKDFNPVYVESIQDIELTISKFECTDHVYVGNCMWTHNCKRNKGTSKRPVIQSVATKELEKLVKEQNCDPAKLMIKFAKYRNLSSKLKKLVEAYEAGMPFRFHVFPNRVPSLRLASGTYNIEKKPYWYFLPVNSQALTKSPAAYKRVDVNFDTWDITFGDDQPYLVETQDDTFNLRSFLVPHDEDSILVRCDFKSEEIRIISNIAQIDPLVDAINNGRDPHKYVASKMYGVPYDEVTPIQRKKAKEISLGTGYGATEYTVSNKLSIPIDDARDAFSRYKAEIPQLFQWQERVKQEATFTGECKLSFGWSLKLRFWVKSRNQKVRDYGYRRGWNQIQCYAGFCLRLAHIKLFNLIWKKPKPEEIGKMSASGCTVGKWYGKGLYPVLSLHDEVVISVPKKYATEFIEDLYYLLKSTTLPGWKVPLIADIEVATRYGAVVPLSVEELPNHHLKFAVAAEKEKVEIEEPEEEIIEEEDDTEEFGGISF